MMDGRAGGRHPEDGDDRRELSQGVSHGDQPAVEKGGPGNQRGRLIGRSAKIRKCSGGSFALSMGGLNTELHAAADAEGADPLLHDCRPGQG